jgi:hypothetical protein
LPFCFPNFSCKKMVSERIGALIGESKVSRIESGNATNLANFTLFLFAYIFGNTKLLSNWYVRMQCHFSIKRKYIWPSINEEAWNYG